jgi:hypothetical protein
VAEFQRLPDQGRFGKRARSSRGTFGRVLYYRHRRPTSYRLPFTRLDPSHGGDHASRLPALPLSCGNALYYPGIGAVPDLSKQHYFTCPRLPVAIRVTRGDWWKPVKEKPEGAIEVQRGDEVDRAG